MRRNMDKKLVTTHRARVYQPRLYSQKYLSDGAARRRRDFCSTESAPQELSIELERPRGRVGRLSVRGFLPFLCRPNHEHTSPPPPAMGLAADALRLGSLCHPCPLPGRRSDGASRPHSVSPHLTPPMTNKTLEKAEHSIRLFFFFLFSDDGKTRSMLFCLVFAGLIGGCVFLGRTPAFRAIPLYTLFVASLFLFLAFAIRAGIANSSDPPKSSFVAQSLFLVFAQLCVLDAWMARIRDEYIDFLDDSNRVDLRGPAGWKSLLNMLKEHAETRWVMMTRLLIWPLCLTLYMVGYATLPSPEDGLQTDRHGATREVASFLLFIVIATMQALSLKHACFELPPWLPFTILFAISLLLWLPALCEYLSPTLDRSPNPAPQNADGVFSFPLCLSPDAFCLLAVVPDDASFVKAKTFFYVGYGFGHAVAIGGLLALHRYSRVWEYPLPQDDEAHDDEPKEQPPQEDLWANNVQEGYYRYTTYKAIRQVVFLVNSSQQGLVQSDYNR
ncbi:hypothetical protein VP01_1463g3 [Puccinia sorghi]|uniref:Uncharacterized protein n=1 Tax=Puccinia sorghi TaxID=27349 RepID=A0A0L6VJY1_9BASI|nr:hypothetical protein VP01_1463g3 [Puccinia sorghi]